MTTKTTVTQQVDDLARQYTERTPGVTHAQAMDRVLTERPDLYQAYERAAHEPLPEPEPAADRYAAKGAIERTVLATIDRLAGDLRATKGFTEAGAVTEVLTRYPTLYSAAEEARRLDQRGIAPVVTEQAVRTFTEAWKGITL